MLFSGLSDVGELTDPGRDPVHVYAPHSKVQGQTLGEWSARWWQWATSGTTETNPLVDLSGEDAGLNQPKNVFFLAGRRGAGSVERTVTVSSGSKLFFPVLNVSYITFPTDPPMPASELRPLLDGVVGGYSGLYATVDGAAVDVSGHREVDPYPDGFAVTLAEGNIYGQPAGVHEPVVSDGYWLMLKPLPVGEHTITFGGQIREGRRQDITYHVEVVPRGRYEVGAVQSVPGSGTGTVFGATHIRPTDDVFGQPQLALLA